MESLNVLATFPVDEGSVRLMEQVRPGVRVSIVPYNEPPGRWRADGSKPTLSAELLQALKSAHVVYSQNLPPGVVRLAPNLKWVQNIGAGIEHLLPEGGTGLWDSDVVITSAKGVHSRPVAEFAVGFMLWHVKRMPAFMERQTRSDWSRVSGETLDGKTVGIVGLGNIGKETARLCKAFQMTVLGNQRSASGETVANVDRLLGPDGLEELLAASDFVVLALPAVPETYHIIGERQLRLMKRNAMIINVARGSVLDQEALCRALEEGWIGAAGIDCQEQEPLPPHSPLWKAPNIIITPHSAASTTDYVPRTARFFVENLKRFVAGEPLVGVVDRQKGY